MKADDPRIHFRKIEVEVAYTFAVRAAVEPMALHEESPLTLFRQSPADLKKDIEAIIKRTCRLTMWYSV
ncbi:MAG: hypothetical protein CSA23_00185 [Deltaproteobacteria bacterium]|nr:MAG: hypothetical protein CSA23_00185 [Deltaproteobacteria bacterium]